MQGQCSHKWQGDDEPGHSSIDSDTLSYKSLISLNSHPVRDMKFISYQAFFYVDSRFTLLYQTDRYFHLIDII